MLIGGLQKTTLIDFPGRVACTVFTVGCNFRCPFCHNKDLVTLKNFKESRLQPISEQSFFEFLEKRKKILDGVCITGGEPTIQPDLPPFCQRIKDSGLEVKVDTNGSNPKMLKKLIDKKLVDFIAMDVKTVFGDYAKTFFKIKDLRSKIKDTEQNSKLICNIKKSIALILKSGLEYEFRTTVVPGIHNKQIIVKLAKELREIAFIIHNSLSIIHYVLQSFRPQNCLDPRYLKLKPFSDNEIQAILKSAQPILPKTKLRGTE